jgi:hypothetical protein
MQWLGRMDKNSLHMTRTHWFINIQYSLLTIIVVSSLFPSCHHCRHFHGVMITLPLSPFYSICKWLMVSFQIQSIQVGTAHDFSLSSIFSFWLPLWFTDSDYPFDLRILITPLIYGFWLPLWFTASDYSFDLRLLITSLSITASDYPFGIFNFSLKHKLMGQHWLIGWLID